MKSYKIGQTIIINKYRWRDQSRLKKARQKARLGLWKRIYPKEWNLKDIAVYKVLSVQTIKQAKHLKVST